MLQPLTNGILTFDNLDYVSRDSYMCGVAVGPIDRERLIYYTFVSPKGLTLHRSGEGALTMFLNARKYLYENVYFHRTTRPSTRTSRSCSRKPWPGSRREILWTTWDGTCT